MTSDELLARIDERTANTYHLMEKQESHLRTLNGSVAANAKAIAVINAQCRERHPRYAVVRPMGIGAGAMALLVAAFELVTRLLS